MPFYRHKPIIVEAWQNVPGVEVPEWVQVAVASKGTILSGSKFVVMELEANFLCRVNDWLVKGVGTEEGYITYFPPEEFAELYEPTEDEP